MKASTADQKPKNKIESKVVEIMSSANTDSEKTSKIISLFNKKFIKLENQLETVSEELDVIKTKKKFIEEKKVKRRNRKRLPIRAAISEKHYNFLITEISVLNYNNMFLASRLRLTLALLAVTGIGISDLLQLKIKKVKPLFSDNCLIINENNKAFLSIKGAQLIQARIEDFKFICHGKSDNSYLFTAKNSDKPLARETFTNSINKFIKESAKKIQGQPVLSTYSFSMESHFISELWSNPSDIKFIKQVLNREKKSRTQNLN